MIINPEAVNDARLKIIQEREDIADNPLDTKKGVIVVKRLKARNYDAEVERTFRNVETRVVALDAKILPERQLREGGYGPPKHYRSLTEYLTDPQVRRRMAAHYNSKQLKEIGEQLIDMRGPRGGELRTTHLREASDFSLGLYADEATGRRNAFRVQDTILPALSGPHGKNQLFSDIQEMHARAFEAATRNPLGKRICLAGDTQIPLLDGTAPTLEELAERGGQFWVYAATKAGTVTPALAHAPRLTGVRSTVQVVIDTGEVVEATPDHPFMLRDGTFRDAGLLKPGDSLMPLYKRRVLTGSKRNGQQQETYEEVWHPELSMWEFTHRLVARTCHREAFFQCDVPNRRHWHVHHDNDNTLDNQPDNLAVITQPSHASITSSRPENIAKKRALPNSRDFGAKVKQLWADPEWREKQRAKFKAASTPEKRAKLSAIAKERAATPGFHEVHSARMRVAQAGRSRDAAGRYYNHKVVAVEPGPTIPVYDLTVPGFENFAIGQGIFVHNCKILGQFVLGRGLMGKIHDEGHQVAWDDFWERNDLSLEIKVIFRDLITFGEIFLRYYNQQAGLVVRSLDPSTIWDIVTEADDIKSVLYYHQQYVVSNFVFSAFVVDRPASTLIIRQIQSKDLDHFKINATGSEKRGRSELYAILGWLVRIKEFMNDRIVLNKMRAMFALDVKVTGGPTELATAEAQFATPPDSGSVLVHNDAVEVEYKNAQTNANEAQTDANMFLKIIAVGSGVSESFLGVSANSTRAGALIQTEPDVKNFEDYQELVEGILRRAYRRVVTASRLPKTKARFEVSFPSIAQEDRSAKLKDLALSQAMEWLSAERAAAMAAKEFSVTDYSYHEEQVVIRQERTADVMVAQGFQSLPKIAPDPLAGGEEPALAGPPKFPESPGHPGEPKGLSHTAGQMGFSGRRGGRDLSDTKPTLDRSHFTRGGERASIKGRKSAGAPTYESADGAPKSRVWSAAARAKSLATRRANAEKRRAALQATRDGGETGGEGGETA